MEDEEQQTLFEDTGAIAASVTAPLEFSKYVVFVDESGDHGLVQIDQQYPVFVLAFCVFHKRHYTEAIVPTVHEFKFRHFGHDVVVLHEHEIRKRKGAFSGFFTGAQTQQAFMTELGEIVEGVNFVLISCVIRKDLLQKAKRDIYHLALEHCLEGLRAFLDEKGELEATTHIVFEARGKQEDEKLELEFRRICSGQNSLRQPFPFEIVLAHKQTNSVGLQLADLVARPVGISVLRPGQPNRAFDVLRQKFFCKGGRTKLGVDYEGYGLKVLP